MARDASNLPVIKFMPRKVDTQMTADLLKRGGFPVAAKSVTHPGPSPTLCGCGLLASELYLHQYNPAIPGMKDRGIRDWVN